jgi:hypothetical protein
MKKSELTFSEGFTTNRGINNNPHRVFDWDKASHIIKDTFSKHPDLVAEAGLQGDWNYTGGTIFENGKPVLDSYTYLASNWAIPTLILSYDGEDQQQIECWLYQSDCRFTSDSKWDSVSLSIFKDQDLDKKLEEAIRQGMRQSYTDFPGSTFNTIAECDVYYIKFWVKKFLEDHKIVMNG